MEHNLFFVFILGGALCLFAQLLIDLTALTPARILVMYVCLGVLLFGVGIYDPMLKIFGCGASLPLIGFGANIGRGVREAIDSHGMIGILEGGLTSSAAGITAALLSGFIFSFLFKSKTRRMGKSERALKS